MSIPNKTKIPLLIVSGVFLGLIIATILMSSTISDGNVNPKNNNIELYDTPYQVFQPTVPTEVWFADEKVPIEFFDVYESLDRELIINTYRHSSTILYVKRAKRYFPIIEPILQANGIPDDFKYLCVAESGLDHAISPAGATGFWQFMKTTGREYNLEVNNYIDERYNIIKTTSAACNYLNNAYKKFGNWTLAAVSYNMGMAGLQRRLDQQKVDNYWDLYLTPEPARYVYRIVALKIVMSNPELYGFNIPTEDLYHPINYYPIIVDTTINNLQEFALKFGINYKLLKIFNPWIRDTMLMNRSGKEYTLIIPDSTARVR
ncbi:MAG TPA: lytic transglycosylase domain-containing protein [Bacteroidales bacterium]|nr:lytic transglycosylase domain-containing protein [Bacteroidales bacterium]HXK81570.1 lytic transglycosylase domain-containing protein [Bacteroidales bacterium]